MTDRRAWRRAVACAPSAHAHALSANDGGGADLRAAGRRPGPHGGPWLGIAILGAAATGLGLIAGTHALLLIGPVFLGAIVHVWWCALTGRRGRWLRLAVVAILGEGAFVAAKCRLGGATTLA